MKSGEWPDTQHHGMPFDLVAISRSCTGTHATVLDPCRALVDIDIGNDGWLMKGEFWLHSS